MYDNIQVSSNLLYNLFISSAAFLLLRQWRPNKRKDRIYKKSYSKNYQWSTLL